MQLDPEILEEDGGSHQFLHLIFQLDNELYGIELKTVKEIIKKREIKAVPYMASHFKGIMNLRGQIVSVVDLRARFQFPIKDHDKGLILVIETGKTLMAAIVDDVVSVSDIAVDDITRNHTIESKIPPAFFQGVAKTGDRLVSLLDIVAALSQEDFVTIQRLKEAI